MQKDTYRRIKKFSENMEAMLRVYGMLELEDAYKIYCTLYDKNQDKTEFYRYVYWYGSFNCIFKTAYTGDGRCFSFIEDIDSQKVIAMQEKYAADMDYASFSIEDIRLLSENLANRTEWIDILFSKLRYQGNIPLKNCTCMNSQKAFRNGRIMPENLENPMRYKGFSTLKNRKMYAQKNSYICFAMHVLHLEKRQKQKLC